MCMENRGAVQPANMRMPQPQCASGRHAAFDGTEAHGRSFRGMVQRRVTESRSGEPSRASPARLAAPTAWYLQTEVVEPCPFFPVSCSSACGGYHGHHLMPSVCRAAEPVAGAKTLVFTAAAAP